MTTPDRNEELIVEMLERRASTAPPWLTEETTKSVRRVAQRRGGRAGLGTRGRLAAVGGVVAAVALVAGGLAIGSGLVGTTAARSPAPTADVGVLASLAPSEEPTPESAAPVEPTASPSGALAADSIAVVTTAGDGLRVRSLPGTGPDSKLLKPLLERRTRMLVLDGPVRADGYDWYQVYAEEPGLAGWVAAGDDGTAWIRPGKARCPETLDASSLWAAASIDLLVCFQGREAELGVTGMGAYGEASCDPRVYGSDVCVWSPSWFDRQGWLALGEIASQGTDTGGVAGRNVVVAPSVSAQDLDHSSRGATITLSFDHPDATQCRARTGGREAMEPWLAVLACRLMPVVEAVRPDAPIDVEGP